MLAGLVFLAVPPSLAASPATISLGAASSFGVLAKGYVTTGTNSTINGDIGSGAAIDPAIPKSPNFLFRVAEPVGEVVDIAVRVYINRVLVDMVYLTTK
jgi:hypothetical protein